MANNLTGNYQAVFQVSVQQVNGILATMHQARVDKDASPSFPHNASLRIGERPLALEVELSRFRKWAGGAVEGMHAASTSIEHTRLIL
jgi:hypothetical protein